MFTIYFVLITFFSINFLTKIGGYIYKVLKFLNTGVAYKLLWNCIVINMLVKYRTCHLINTPTKIMIIKKNFLIVSLLNFFSQNKNIKYFAGK